MICRKMTLMPSQRSTRPFQFSLRAILLIVGAAGCLLWLGQRIGATYTAISIDAVLVLLGIGLLHRGTRSRFPIALGLAAVHTTLLMVAAIIEFGPGADDMSPSILIYVALNYVDMPLVATMRNIDELIQLKLDGEFAVLALVGAAFWFSVGLLPYGAIRLVKVIRGRFRTPAET